MPGMVKLKPHEVEIEFYNLRTGEVLHRCVGAPVVEYRIPYVDRKRWWWRRPRRFYLTDDKVSARMLLLGHVIADYRENWTERGSFRLEMPDYALSMELG
jgi:hypothetical protein